MNNVNPTPIEFLKSLLDELPKVVEPLFLLCIFFIVFLTIGNGLNLNNTFWWVNKEQIFNLAFYIGTFTLIFRALNKASIEIRKLRYRKLYPYAKINKDYFLGQYKTDKVFLFELVNKKNKLWIYNQQTKRYLWGVVPAHQIDIIQKKISIDGVEIDLSTYPIDQGDDGRIDILNPKSNENIIIGGFTMLFIAITILILNLNKESNSLINGVRLEKKIGTSSGKLIYTPYPTNSELNP